MCATYAFHRLCPPGLCAYRRCRRRPGRRRASQGLGQQPHYWDGARVALRADEADLPVRATPPVLACFAPARARGGCARQPVRAVCGGGASARGDAGVRLRRRFSAPITIMTINNSSIITILFAYYLCVIRTFFPCAFGTCRARYAEPRVGLVCFCLRRLPGPLLPP